MTGARANVCGSFSHHRSETNIYYTTIFCLGDILWCSKSYSYLSLSFIWTVGQELCLIFNLMSVSFNLYLNRGRFFSIQGDSLHQQRLHRILEMCIKEQLKMTTTKQVMDQIK